MGIGKGALFGQRLAGRRSKLCLAVVGLAGTFKGVKTFAGAQMGTFANRGITAWARNRREKRDSRGYGWQAAVSNTFSQVV